jgi:hypothetical protein
MHPAQPTLDQLRTLRAQYEATLAPESYRVDPMRSVTVLPPPPAAAGRCWCGCRLLPAWPGAGSVACVLHRTIRQGGAVRRRPLRSQVRPQAPPHTPRLVEVEVFAPPEEEGGQYRMVEA